MAAKSTGVRASRRWRHALEVSDDPDYVGMLDTLSDASVRRGFHPFTDIDWESSDLAVSDDDPNWVLPETDPIGHHPWYRQQPLETQIAIGRWRQANVAKVGSHLESVLISGLTDLACSMPNGSPEHRYCMHEASEECNHIMMFQELVNRIGVNVAGLPGYLRFLSLFTPFYARLGPNAFFFGVIAGEDPFDHVQKSALRSGAQLHPLVRRVMGVHVAEEARHISFAHEYLRKRLDGLAWWKRAVLSVWAPVIMRMLGVATVRIPGRVRRAYRIPRRVRREMLFGSEYSGAFMQDMFADVRMLCYDTGLMNPIARTVWWACRIDGRPARYRSEPKRRVTT